MDYEQWTPLGRGDPLKNDPTYDYVPPVLERVHYWIDPSSRKPDPPSDTKKTEILVLGVSSKKPSVSYSHADSRRDQYDPYLQFVDGSNYNYQRRPNYPPNYYSSPFFKMNDKEPYTILVPPPMPTMQESISYQQPITSSISTTTSPPTSVTIDEANLIYHSSSTSTADEWKGSNTYATIAEPSSHVTWKTPIPINKTMHQATSYSIVSSIQPSMSVLLEPSHIKNIETDIIVAPEMGMHKGQVTDETLDNTYVNIGKPDAQVQSSGIEAMGDLSTEPLTPPMKDAPMTFGASLFKPMTIKENKPMTLQMTMQTIIPPETTQDMNKKSNFLHGLLKKETKPTPFLPTALPPISTTTISSLTTDPLFKHYKQPVEPLRGPLYLIIQGHSKVKTYGPSKQINGISVQETNEISTSDDRNLDNEFQVKHLHHEMLNEDMDFLKREGRSNKLQTLNHVVVTGLGAIDFQRRNDIKETELVLKYDVSDKETSSEVYHKGIVESEVPPNRPIDRYSMLFEKNK